MFSTHRAQASSALKALLFVKLVQQYHGGFQAGPVVFGLVGRKRWFALRPRRSKLKAWALREVWRDHGKPDHGMLTDIGGKVKKKSGSSPSPSAVFQFFAKVGADVAWLPGKANYDDVGGQPIMTSQQRAVLARCAMTMKKNSIEPTYAKVVAACPTAALHP